MQKQLKILGIVCLVLGGLTFLVSFYSIKLGMPFGFFGMVLSSIYVFLDTKHRVSENSITPGIIGMLLSSTPVVVILTFIIAGYFK